ncbi:MAG: glycoside hydrolase family 97 protein [Cytophagales bacterium]|jgi:alpha-glucosidase|nr:glycoside hydrolase family 97 protein [Cytophagales bacterium]
MRILHFLLTAGLSVSFAAAQPVTKNHTVASPDGRTVVTVTLGDKIRYAVRRDNQPVITESPVSMTLSDGRVLGGQPKLKGQNTASVNRQVKPLYGISSVIPEQYNELSLRLRGNYAVLFRAYNDGIAYRFETRLPGQILVQSEEATFNFASDYAAWFHPSAFLSSWESDYKRMNISAFAANDPKTAMVPTLVELPGGARAAVMESDLLDYPGMNLTAEGQALRGAFAAYPKKTKIGGHNNFNMPVEERESFIARTAGTRTFPWRIVAFADSDKDLLANQLVYLLASESKIGDASWVKPGRVAWDWWCNLNLWNVPFKTGFNTESYKYFIDFAAENGLEYVNLDEGWSDQFDLLKVTDKLDMPEVIRYAKQKNVGLILWCVWHTLDRQMIPALEQFAKWGIAGLKVDFMDRDDQEVVNFYERLLREASKRKMLVNYHGAYKPTGLQRTYPNNINREGVKGLEWNKFSKEGISPEHDVTLPFIRMVAGSMDYTPGAMTNANKTDWRQVFDRPMSQGTRCHQLAMFVTYFAPLQMLSDAPTAYQREPEVLKFLATVPTVWDETRPVDGRVGDYVAVARRKGNVWYAGAMTDWEARTLKMKLDFLGNGLYQAEIFQDGPNAHRVGNDYKRVVRQVSHNDELTVEMAPGGGWTARFTLLK